MARLNEKPIVEDCQTIVVITADGVRRLTKEKLLEIINEQLPDDLAHKDSNNSFTGKNTFNGDVEFNSRTDFNEDVNVYANLYVQDRDVLTDLPMDQYQFNLSDYTDIDVETKVMYYSVPTLYYERSLVFVSPNQEDYDAWHEAGMRAELSEGEDEVLILHWTGNIPAGADWKFNVCVMNNDTSNFFGMVVNG